MRPSKKSAKKKKPISQVESPYKAEPELLRVPSVDLKTTRFKESTLTQWPVSEVTDVSNMIGGDMAKDESSQNLHKMLFVHFTCVRNIRKKAAYITAGRR